MHGTHKNEFCCSSHTEDERLTDLQCDEAEDWYERIPSLMSKANKKVLGVGLMINALEQSEFSC